jgi:helicase
MHKNYTITIPATTKEPVLDIALDTIAQGKQAIVFVNSKRSAESVAEKIAKKLNPSKKEKEYYSKLSEKVLKTLSTPTRQCKRLALCIENGIAFHHAGLHSEQRKLIEQNFRERKIKVICATPTLAQGVDLPAYRTIIRDLKRFTSRGMRSIPVLEYEQQSGRAGRPGMEKLGQAIVFAKDEKDKKYLVKKYIKGEPEDIISKLAVFNEKVTDRYNFSKKLNTEEKVEETINEVRHTSRIGKFL